MSTGFGGYEVNRATAAEVELSVRKMARFHARHGTTARALCARRQPDDSGRGGLITGHREMTKATANTSSRYCPRRRSSWPPGPL